ncbi:heme-binding protein [Tsuneonella rigui]|uniref:heme-binding protein n=1 Tax=Tsuneonella rigui TaxID=1708790 RepID=UPI000F7EE90F|nr:heme-binding protein [Tsuneonella rigui]
MRASPRVAALTIALTLASCGGGGGSSGGSSGGGTSAPGPTPPSTPTAVYTAPALEALTVAEVQRIIAQAAGEAQARGRPAVIAVTDRVGNVLGVFNMNGAPVKMLTSRLTGTGVLNDVDVDVQGIEVVAVIGALAKALTGNYLSSGGNAFSSRTASMIVQANFPPSPGTVGLESGPLSGVQFSQLPCSDLNTRFNAAGGVSAFIGPKRSPLGLAADPGGFPLYKNGVLVGGIGVIAEPDYAFDTNVTDLQVDDEEAIALAGIQGFAPPDAITADKITVDGTALRFSDMRVTDLSPLKTDFAAINNTLGGLVAVTGYSNGGIIAGTPYGTEASGYRQATSAEFAFPDAFVLSNGGGTNRYPIRAGSDAAAVGQPLSAAEARAVLEEAYAVMRHARGQIRRPLDSRAQVTISLVDTYGDVLGVVRAPDAPIFGTDVSLQKARTVAFFSNPVAAQQLLDDPDAEIADFLQRARVFFNDANAFTGKTAFGARSIGNISRPHFPDGEAARPEGPLSRPIADFSPFATGLQIALVKSNLLQHALFVQGAPFSDTPAQCTLVPPAPTGQRRLANGMQIFSGAVPIYRGSTLVGAIGVSGDGIDQDDMISFLGAHNGGARVGGIGNAPIDIRADKIVIPVGAGVRLRYVNCPFAPFLDTNEQNVCEGK